MSSGWKRGSLHVSRMPKPPWRSMKAGARDAGDAAHAHGTIMLCVITSSRPRGARDGHIEDAPRRQILPRLPPCYHLGVEVTVPDVPEEEHGWTVLATTVSAERCADSAIRQAYQEQNTTVEPGFRWIKNPAAISPVWLEKPARIAALAMLTVVGLLVYSVIQRQVRLYLRTHDQQLPGNKGDTATPTAAVVLALFAPVAVVRLRSGNVELHQVYGVNAYHLMVCEALGLDHTWYEVTDSA